MKTYARIEESTFGGRRTIEKHERKKVLRWWKKKFIPPGTGKNSENATGETKNRQEEDGKSPTNSMGEVRDRIEEAKEEGDVKVAPSEPGTRSPWVYPGGGGNTNRRRGGSMPVIAKFNKNTGRTIWGEEKKRGCRSFGKRNP